jgi:hypothetical protein
MSTNPGKWGKQARQSIRDNEEKEGALEGYFLKYVLGLKEQHATEEGAFQQSEVEAQGRRPDPMPKQKKLPFRPGSEGKFSSGGACSR